MVIYALKNAWGGEIFIPKIPSYKITDLAKAIDENCKQEIVGVRAGEKIHEEMISSSDSYTTYDLGDYYVILPYKPYWNLDDFKVHFKAKKVVDGFSYSSELNTNRLNVSELKNLIKIQINSNIF